jgi:GxxExxY protein
MLDFHSENQTAFPHKETQAFIRAAFEVHNHPGYGFLHQLYRRSLQVELARRNLRTDWKKRINVHYKAIAVGDYDAI